MGRLASDYFRNYQVSDLLNFRDFSNLTHRVEFISPSVMIPKNRLAALLDQVKQHQINGCLYHNTAAPPSLYGDHMCDRNNFPLYPNIQLTSHTNEIWYVEFSHDGTKLATASLDHTVIIHDVKQSFAVIHRLAEHEGPVTYVRWSPDDSKVVTCSLDKKAKVWDVEVCLFNPFLFFHGSFGKLITLSLGNAC